jgi:hypothetical protein
VLNTLRSGKPLRDQEFDAIYPAPIRAVSNLYWTPVAVAREAALWLAQAGCERVLDVGAGVGKFCLVGAAVAPNTTFIGIEHRSHLVAVAQAAARHCGLRNLLMLQGEMSVAPWRDCNGFYFFNPFDENNFAEGAQLDDTVELTTKRYIRDVAFAERCLAAARPGTRVVTYHGFGGAMPVEYILEHEQPHGMDYLRYWVKGSLSRRRLVEWSVRPLAAG